MNLAKLLVAKEITFVFLVKLLIAQKVKVVTTKANAMNLAKLLVAKEMTFVMTTAFAISNDLDD